MRKNEKLFGERGNILKEVTIQDTNFVSFFWDGHLYLGVPVCFQGPRLPEQQQQSPWETYLSFLSCLGTKRPSLFTAKRLIAVTYVGPLHLFRCANQFKELYLKKKKCISRLSINICIKHTYIYIADMLLNTGKTISDDPVVGHSLR